MAPRGKSAAESGSEGERQGGNHGQGTNVLKFGLHGHAALARDLPARRLRIVEFLAAQVGRIGNKGCFMTVVHIRVATITVTAVPDWALKPRREAAVRCTRLLAAGYTDHPAFPSLTA